MMKFTRYGLLLAMFVSSVSLAQVRIPVINDRPLPEGSNPNQDPVEIGNGTGGYTCIMNQDASKVLIKVPVSVVKQLVRQGLAECSIQGLPYSE